MERAANKAARLLQIESLLLAHPEGLSQAEIARRIGVNRSTIHRYLPDLTREFALYEHDDGRLAIDRDHYLLNVRLTLHESMALHLAARLMATRTDKQNPHAAAALRKLGLALESLAPRVAQHLKASASVMDDQAQRHDPAYLRVLETLTRAWSDGRIARVWHRLADGRVFNYEFSPYYIEPYAVGRTTHAIGWRKPPNALRTFKLERIERIELTDRTYTIPDEFDPGEQLASAWGIWYTETEPLEVVLRFHPRVAHRVRETQWHRSEQVTEQLDGSLIWRGRVAEPQEMVPWIRGWGAAVEVVAPQHLREALEGETRRLAALYHIQPTPTYEVLWAKTSKDRTRTHALVHHLLDVGQVTVALWDHAFPAAMRRFFETALEMDATSTRQWLAFASAMHDLGKACPAFQEQHLPSKQELAAKGLPFEDQFVRMRTPHGWVTARELAPLLEERLGFVRRVARNLARATGGHHGVFPQDLNLQQLGPSQRGVGAWEVARAELFDALAQIFQVQGLPPWPRDLAYDTVFWTVLAGLVSFADWLGSIESYFFDLSAPTVERYAELAYGQAVFALEKLGWTGWSPPQEAKAFRELFVGYEPRPLQQAAIDLADDLQPPALVIVEAPTGEGKTEAALYLADRWIGSVQQRGAYIAMPTQATSNQMLGRVRTYLETRYASQQVQLLLLHGAAAWSEDMEELRLAAIDEEAGSTVVAHSWFLPRKRSFLAPYAVGTVDQALMSVLQTKHFFVRLFGLGHKTVVFDEIHAYDTYMSTLFQRLLAWLAAMDTTVVLLSATLPDRARRDLLRAYTGRCVALPSTYPAICWATADGAGIVPLATSATSTRTLAVEWTDREPSSLAGTLGAALADGGCAAVICNTVARAQQIYRTIREAGILPAKDVLLFHARFPLIRRQEIEAEVLERFGKEGHGPRRGIVVATQVIEQSLDLDFDLMVTDLAPIDLVLQRAGRLHRHQRDGRPARLAEPRLLIAEPEEFEGLPQWGSDKYVYEAYVLLRSFLTLRALPRSRLAVPDDVRSLVEQVYGEETLIPGPPCERALEALAEAREAMEGSLGTDRFQALQKLIPKPGDEDVLSGDNRQLDEDNPDLHESWRAMTRLAPPSVTLVCLHRQAEGITLDPEGGPLISLDAVPDRQLSFELARRSLGISTYPVVRHFLEQEPPPGWSKHPMLRYHRAAVFEGGRCDLGERLLVLDRDLGLIVEKRE